MNKLLVLTYADTTRAYIYVSDEELWSILQNEDISFGVIKWEIW